MVGQLAFHARFDEQGDAQLELRETTPSKLPFAKPRVETLPFDDWPLRAPARAGAATARLMQAWSDDERDSQGRLLVEAAANSARIAAGLVVTLNDADALALGLPPAAKVSLNLRSRDHIASEAFRIEKSWTRANGQPVNVHIEGARVRLDGREWRLVEPISTIASLVDEVNSASDIVDRQAALAAMRRALPDDFQSHVQADGYIEKLRLSYAAAFSLSLDTTSDGFNFDPVLFAREAAEHSEQDGAQLDQHSDSLLPPRLQADFVQRFRSGTGDRRTYLLDDGSIVFLDPALFSALKVVRKAQSLPAAQRMAFARNPRRAIREGVGADVGIDASEALDALFIETQQFSERVSGIDEWRKPVLPWIKPKPNSWLPEQFGLRIGEGDDAKDVPLDPAFVAPALEAVEQAIANAQPDVEIAGVVVPATEQTRAALASLQELVAAAAGASKDQTRAPASLAGRYFLQIKDNLAELEYAPLAVEAAPPLPPALPPGPLKSTLKPHQVEGFRWLTDAWRAGMPGVVLADDMGLGKTFQALAFMAWLREQGANRKPVLIVAPTGLLANWQSEIRTHLAPDALGVVVRAYGAGLHFASGGKAKDIALGSAQLDHGTWNDAGVVLTTYETMRDYHMSFARTPFAAIIYDEVQKLKNPASQMTRAAKTLNARFQIAMTGTPVENRLQDLWSILDVVFPGLLGSSRDFEQTYPASQHEKLRELNDRLTQPSGDRPAVLLRRMKGDHLPGLPAKHITALPLDMPPEQARAYATAVARAVALRGTGQGSMLQVLHQLRGVSLHPRSPESAGLDVEAYIQESARLQSLFATLSTIKEKREKVLIFCESLAMQALLALQIKRLFALPHDVPRIHGRVTGDARQHAVEIFQSRAPGFDVMILSPKAGGVGLTLTAANHVVHLSRWWNPAVEDQATDRVYRIGQTRDVQVYLPQSVHPDAALRETSFDLKLDALMRRKRELSRGLLLPPEDDGDTDDLFDAVTGADAVLRKQSSESAATEATVEVQNSDISKPAESVSQTLTIAPKSTLQTSVALQDVAAQPRYERKSFSSGSSRDFSIIESPVRGADIISVSIRDPYACASPWHRSQVIDFVKRLEGVARRIEAVTVLAYDADSVNRNQPETNSRQYTDIETRWRQRFPNGPRLRTQLISRRQVQGFHDRRVEVTTRDGKRILWDLSNGVDGLMGVDKECTVFLTIEMAA